jgi:beta-propeller repeat-containing protein
MDDRTTRNNVTKPLIGLAKTLFIPASAFMLPGIIFPPPAAAAATAPQIEWARQFGGVGAASEFGTAIAADGNRNTYVGGTTNGALPMQTSAGLTDAFC